MSVEQDLRRAVEDLIYPSESDSPVEVVVFGEGELAPWESGVDGPVEEVSLGEFFGPLNETDDASRWHLIHSLMGLGLSDARVFRIGEVRVVIYVLGEEKSTGRRVGIRMEGVET